MALTTMGQKLQPRVDERLLTVLCLLILTLTSHGQKRNANWAISGGQNESTPGSMLGDMDMEPSVVSSIDFDGSECYAALSDTSGTLLFYAGRGLILRPDGSTLYMPFNTYNNDDVTQGPLILPRTGNSEFFDVFMIEAAPDSDLLDHVLPRCVHLVVDMTAEAGQGGVVLDETFGYNLAEKLTGTPHANGTDYWVLLHEWQSDKFLAYQVGAGLDTVPVISETGAVHASSNAFCPYNRNFQGEMKMSYRGDRIALCTQNAPCGNDSLQPSIVQVFSFDDVTGAVQYRMTLTGHAMSYGLEFSQDGSKLYVSGTDAQDRYVDQYELNSPDTSAVQNSRTRIFSTSYNGIPGGLRPNAMELAPNGKIYVSHTGNGLDVIDFPGTSGVACGYSMEALPFANYHYFSGHANHIKRYHDSEFTVGVSEGSAADVLRCWPSPASDGRVWLSIPAQYAHGSTRIHDDQGRLVRQNMGIKAGVQSLDLAGLAPGLYTVLVSDGTEHIGQARLFLE